MAWAGPPPPPHPVGRSASVDALASETSASHPSSAPASLALSQDPSWHRVALRCLPWPGDDRLQLCALFSAARGLGGWCRDQFDQTGGDVSVGGVGPNGDAG